MELPRDRELSRRVAARVLHRGHALEARSVRLGNPALPQTPDDRRRDDRPGPPRAAQQSLLEAARGNLGGIHSIRVNSQWRLVFRWDGNRGEAEGVYLDDHSY